MTLFNISTDHAASPHGGGIDPKTVRGVVIGIVLVLAAIGILAVSNVIGSTVKERVTDPVIDKGVETVGDIAAIPAENKVASDAEERVVSMFVRGYSLDPSMVTVEEISLEAFREIQAENSEDSSVAWSEAPEAETFTFSAIAAGRPYVVITWRNSPGEEWLYNAYYTGE